MEDTGIVKKLDLDRRYNRVLDSKNAERGCIRNNSYYLLRNYQASGTVLNASYVSFLIILTTTL